MALTIQFGRRNIVVTPDGSTDFDITAIFGNAIPVAGGNGNAFTVGETVTQATSSATGIVAKWQKGMLVLSSMTGVFDATNTITGGTSSATCIPVALKPAFPNGVRLSAIDFMPSAANDILIVRNGSAVGPILYYRKDTTGGGIHRSVGGRSLREKPFIKGSGDNTFSNAANARISFEFD